jgi:hypothetical protein
MSAFAKTLLPSLLMFSLSGLFAFPTNALAANIIEGFTRVPTFTPPAGCVPTERAYGVLSRCEKTIEPGHSFSASVDTSAGWFVGQEDFVREQVADIKSYWTKDYPGKNLAFSSRASDVVPGNASTRDITCMEYSVTEITEATGSQSAETMMRIEGLTCAWDVEHAAEGKPTVELFWLEAAEAYLPSIGQKPMDSFDSIARELFASARLLLPRAYLVPSDAAKSAMLDWTESEANACLGPPRGSDQVAGLTRYLYSRDGCQIQLIFRNGKVYSAEGYGSEQECWWVADACDRGRSFQEAPHHTWQRWTTEEVAACFGVPTPDHAAYKHLSMRTERDGCSMRLDLDERERLSIDDWSEADKGACRRLLRKCEETLPWKF